MKVTTQLVLAALTVAASASVYAEDRHYEGHEHHGAAATQELRLDAGRKWPTDAPLRQAMGDIDRAMAKALPQIHRGSFDEAEYKALAAQINDKVAYAVKNCRLEPKADAMLHLVLADLIAGAEAMQGGTPDARQEGAVRVENGLTAYGDHFQHDGWRKR